MLKKLVNLLVPSEPAERPGTPAEGEPARAVVTYHYGDLEYGSRQRWCSKYADLRLANDPPDGPVTRVQVYLNQEAHKHVRLGTLMPVRLKPGTRTIIAIDAEVFEAEVAAGGHVPGGGPAAAASG